VRVDQRGVLHVVIHGATPLLVDRLQLDLDSRSSLCLPFGFGVLLDHRRVLLGVDGEQEQVRGLLLARAGDDLHRPARGELPVHPRGGYADALLSALLLEPVELGTVEQLAENPRYLRSHDTRTVVLDRHTVTTFAHLGDLDLQVGQDPRLLAGVERIVHRLTYRREQRLAGVVETEQVPVLGEEFGDGNLALACCHGLSVLSGRFRGLSAGALLRGRAAPRRASRPAAPGGVLPLLARLGSRAGARGVEQRGLPASGLLRAGLALHL